MKINVQNRDDLHRVYMFVYDNFATSTSDVAHALKGINLRYARELLGTLQQADLIVITEGDEGDVWQTLPSYDNMTTEEAEAKFNEWAGEPPSPMNATSPRSSAPKAASAEPHECLCGCGEVITTRSLYRPGHDARHAGVVGREIAANYTTRGFDRRELLATLGSDKLREKAERIAENVTNKGKKPEPTWTEGIVKVGKNERPARRNSAGTVEYLPLKGDWKTASVAATLTFQEG